jgi:cysteine desulfurase
VLLYLLDEHGIHASTGSACQAGIPEPSHVLLAMGVPTDEAWGAIRLTLSYSTTEAEMLWNGECERVCRKEQRPRFSLRV